LIGVRRGLQRTYVGGLLIGVFIGALGAAGYVLAVWPHPVEYYTNATALVYNAPGYAALVAVFILAVVLMRGRVEEKLSEAEKALAREAE
jgi:hypothetical protein